MKAGKKQPKAKPKSEQPTYRFKVGDFVLCKTGSGRSGWEPGSIIKLGYKNPGDPTVHPYQVRCQAGSIIFVPYDTDEICKKYDPAWWEYIMQRDDLSDAEGIKLLRVCSRNKDVNATNHEGDSVLHSALYHQWDVGILELLELRADPNYPGNKHTRPLSMALPFGRDVVKAMLDAKANPCLQDEDPEKDDDYQSISFEERQWHRSALHYAAAFSLEITQLLIQERADINQVDAQRKQPLHLAIEERRSDIVDVLLESRADVDTGNLSLGLNSTPLIDAACRSDTKLVEKLLMARSDVNRQGKQGMTALHMAVRGRQPDTVRLLVNAGADVSIEAAGKTAAQLAEKNGMKELICVLDPAKSPMNDNVGERHAMLDADVRKQLFLD